MKFFNVLLLFGSFFVAQGMDEGSILRVKYPDRSIVYIYRTSDETVFAEKKIKEGKETFEGCKRPIDESQDVIDTFIDLANLGCLMPNIESNALNEEEKMELWHELHAKYKRESFHH